MTSTSCRSESASAQSGLPFCGRADIPLDLTTQAEVTKFLAETARDTGMALLLVSHNAQLIQKTADRSLQLGGTEPIAVDRYRLGS